MDDDSNRQRLRRLLDTGGIRLRPTPLLDRAPEPVETEDLEDRVRGMLLGLAIGDALGATSGPSSCCTSGSRRRSSGPIPRSWA
jgi:hypothetical protein